MLSIPEQVEQYIETGLPCEYLEVEDDGQHFFTTIVSAQFEGKRLIRRHQLVYVVLDKRMRTETHTLSMKMLIPVEQQP